MTFTAAGLALGMGLVMGVLGAGGSILAVPALAFLLHVPAKDAVAMSLLVVGFCAAVGAVAGVVRGVLPLKTAVVMGVASSVGAFAGGAIGARLSDHAQLLGLAAVMIAAAILMWRTPQPPSLPDGSRTPFLMALGAGIGVLTGIVGVGGGFLMVPALTIGAGLPMRRAAAASLFVIMIAALSALPNYLGHLTVSWGFIVPFTLIAAAATIAGGLVAARLPQRRLRQSFAFGLVVLASYVLTQA